MFGLTIVPLMTLAEFGMGKTYVEGMITAQNSYFMDAVGNSPDLLRQVNWK